MRLFRGKIIKKDSVNDTKFIIQDNGNEKCCNKSWAHLIKKIYEVDPLICPRHSGDIRIIAFIEDYKLVNRVGIILLLFDFPKILFNFSVSAGFLFFVLILFSVKDTVYQS